MAPVPDKPQFELVGVSQEVEADREAIGRLMLDAFAHDKLNDLMFKDVTSEDQLAYYRPYFRMPGFKIFAIREKSSG